MTAWVVIYLKGQAAWELSPSLWKWMPLPGRQCQSLLGLSDTLLLATTTQLLDVGATHTFPKSQTPAMTEVGKYRQDVSFLKHPGRNFVENIKLEEINIPTD